MLQSTLFELSLSDICPKQALCMAPVTLTFDLQGQCVYILKDLSDLFKILNGNFLTVIVNP